MTATGHWAKSIALNCTALGNTEELAIIRTMPTLKYNDIETQKLTSLLHFLTVLGLKWVITK